MNTQITGYQISYFVFSIFVSCLIVFTIHKGFQTQDIITIPIFANKFAGSVYRTVALTCILTAGFILGSE